MTDPAEHLDLTGARKRLCRAQVMVPDRWSATRSALTMTDRRVHARNHNWELARYNRQTRWRLEWVGDSEPPSTVNIGTRDRPFMRHVTRTGRADVWVAEIGDTAFNLGMTPELGLPGGSTFDAAYLWAARYEIGLDDD